MSTSRRRTAAELEARIAQLDERLRVARMASSSAPRDASVTTTTAATPSQPPATREGSVERMNATTAGGYPPNISPQRIDLSATQMNGTFNNMSVNLSTPLIGSARGSGNAFRSPVAVPPTPQQSPPPTHNSNRTSPPRSQQPPTQAQPQQQQHLNQSHNSMNQYSQQQQSTQRPLQQLAGEETTATEGGAFVSPWREASIRAQVQATAQLEAEAVKARERRLEGMRQDVTKTADEIAQKDVQLLWYTARRDHATADTHRILREASDKLESLEQEEGRMRIEIHDTKTEASRVEQQLAEVRESMARAQQRAHQYRAERANITATLLGYEQEMKERDEAEKDFHRHQQEVVVANLTARIKTMKEEVRVSHERLAQREAAVAATRASSEAEAQSLQADLQEAKKLLQDINGHNDALVQEVQEIKKQSAINASQRASRLQDTERKRIEGLKNELTRIQQDNTTSERKVKEQLDAVHAQLQDEHADLSRRVEKKSNEHMLQKELIRCLNDKLAAVKANVANKEGAVAAAELHEQEVAELIRRREDGRATVEALKREILQHEDSIRRLEAEAGRLNDLLDEESKLKMYLANLSQEVAASKEMQNEECKQLQVAEEAMGESHKEALVRAAAADEELHRIKAENASDLDALSRKLHEARSQMRERESKLNLLLNKNTQLQSTIIKFEEDKRRLEREDMLRKQQAAKAAKAALIGLE